MGHIAGGVHDPVSGSAASTSTGRHTVAEFRQKWIDKVIDALSEHNAVLLTLPDDGPSPIEDVRRLAMLRTRLDILLNPQESEPKQMRKILDSIPRATKAAEREEKAREAVKIARKHLKAEWVRIKKELN